MKAMTGICSQFENWLCDGRMNYAVFFMSFHFTLISSMNLLQVTTLGTFTAHVCYIQPKKAKAANYSIQLIFLHCKVQNSICKSNIECSNNSQNQNICILLIKLKVTCLPDSWRNAQVSNYTLMRGNMAQAIFLHSIQHSMPDPKL